MRIGIVTTWFERGAAYVSRTYLELLTNLGHNVFIYARGGDGQPEKGISRWNENYVTRDNKYNDTQVDMIKFSRWIEKNSLDLVLFNEQRNYLSVAKVKKKYPNLIIGAYVDYYTEDTLSLFRIYDFVICNTLRHLQAMKDHPQAYYLKWGIDTELYKRDEEVKRDGLVTFFHSVGMSSRKGTDILLDAFLKGELFKRSRLVVHTQVPINKVCSYTKEYLQLHNIIVIEKTVSAPGLYQMGDVYVYPTKLDGLGLTLYEALAFHMPVITTDYPPMNEVITEEVGSLVKVNDHYCRSDAYYYPMTKCDENDLIEKMRVYIDNPSLITLKGEAARERAIKEYSLTAMQESLSEIINHIYSAPLDEDLYNYICKKYCSPVVRGLKEISESNNKLRNFKSKIYKMIKK